MSSRHMEPLEGQIGLRLPEAVLSQGQMAQLKARARGVPSLPCSEWEPILDTARYYMQRCRELEARLPAAGEGT